LLAFALCLALFVWFGYLGLALLSLLHSRRNLLQNALLAPAIGSALLVVMTFWLSRAGLPVGQFAVALAVVLTVLASLVLWRIPPKFPTRRYLPFAATLVVAALITGRPMFEFGFQWVSIANDDMANYVLSARRFLQRGYDDKPTAEAIENNQSMPDYFYYVYHDTGARPGSDLLLAVVTKLTGLDGFKVFMPLIVSLHLVLITTATALACQHRFHRWPALLAMVLLTFSPLLTLGASLQLIAQVFGLSMLAAAALLLLRPLTPMPLRSSIRYGLLAGLVLSAAVIIYAEIVPFLFASLFVYLALCFLRDRSFRPATITPMLLAGLSTLLMLNRFAVEAAAYVLVQIGDGTKTHAQEIYLFPFFLLPTGLANFWGILPMREYPSNPWVLNLSIAFGGLLLALAFLASCWQSWRLQPAAVVCAIMFCLAGYLFIKRADYGLYKLAMFIQPFLLPTLVRAWLRFHGDIYPEQAQ